ncbi:hypothetical protein DRW41_06195 [Neobacillus piezotolerans]|uniref:YwdI family protein n=1 Tax=Neobacillus piezotolerans TaxID=2259171 RepID=A0A3D8GSH9_9BACI|nr:YwdI family protein [Neobacillus piezotolerans]RDU37434.1 hypothetical protein DRW41_06195 [Neobacillus piezotolerans]
MNIHIKTLLAKMEEELVRAKAAEKEDELREKLYSIKTLCEVVLADSTKPVQVERRPLTERPFQAARFQAQDQGKKLVLDDDANGDSIFDF